MPITTTHDRHSRTGSEFFYLPLGANGGWSKETSRGSISLNNRRRLAVSNFNPQLNVIEFLHSVQILISPIEQLTALGQVRDLSRLKLFLLDRTALEERILWLVVSWKTFPNSISTNVGNQYLICDPRNIYFFNSDGHFFFLFRRCNGKMIML